MLFVYARALSVGDVILSWAEAYVKFNTSRQLPVRLDDFQGLFYSRHTLHKFLVVLADMRNKIKQFHELRCFRNETVVILKSIESIARTGTSIK